MQCSQFCSIVIFEAQIHLRSLHFGVQSPYETLHKTGGRLRFASTIFSRKSWPAHKILLSWKSFDLLSFFFLVYRFLQCQANAGYFKAL